MKDKHNLELTGNSNLCNNKLSLVHLKQPSSSTDCTIKKTNQLLAFRLITLLLKRPIFTFLKFNVFVLINRWSIQKRNFCCRYFSTWSLNWPMIPMLEESEKSKFIMTLSDQQNKIWQNSQNNNWEESKITRKNWKKSELKRITWHWKNMNNSYIMRK